MPLDRGVTRQQADTDPTEGPRRDNAELTRQLAEVTRERDILARQVVDLGRGFAHARERSADVEAERDYLRRALAAALTKIPAQL